MNLGLKQKENKVMGFTMLMCEKKEVINTIRHINTWWWGHSVDIVNDDGTAIVCVKFDEKTFPKTGYICNLSVVEKARKKGLGWVMMQFALNVCRERMAAQQEVERLEAQEMENKPKVVFADAVSGSNSACLIGELAKMIAQNGYPIGEKRLFQWLRDNHYLCAYGERFNQPYQQYIEQGLFTMKQNVFSVNGDV